MKYFPFVISIFVIGSFNNCIFDSKNETSSSIKTPIYKEDNPIINQLPLGSFEPNADYETKYKSNITNEEFISDSKFIATNSDGFKLFFSPYFVGELKKVSNTSFCNNIEITKSFGDVNAYRVIKDSNGTVLQECTTDNIDNYLLKYDNSTDSTHFHGNVSDGIYLNGIFSNKLSVTGNDVFAIINGFLHYNFNGIETINIFIRGKASTIYPTLDSDMSTHGDHYTILYNIHLLNGKYQCDLILDNNTFGEKNYTCEIFHNDILYGILTLNDGNIQIHDLDSNFIK